MKKETRVYINGTYTPKRTKKYWKRNEHEDLLRKLQFELTKTNFTATLNYLTDYELYQEKTQSYQQKYPKP